MKNTKTGQAIVVTKISKEDVAYHIDGLLRSINEQGNMNHETMKLRLVYVGFMGRRVRIHVNNECVGEFSHMETLVYLQAFSKAWIMSKEASQRWFAQYDLIPKK